MGATTMGGLPDDCHEENKNLDVIERKQQVDGKDRAEA